MNTKTALRFGLLCNGPVLEKWQADAVVMLVEAGMHLELVVLRSGPSGRQTWLKRLKAYPYSRFLFRLWNRFLFRPASKAPVNLLTLYPETETQYCTPITKGVANYFSPDDIDSIKDHKLDFLLRFGFNIIRGGILEAAQYGVWSFHHDDEEVIRGGPPGFWEVYKGMDVNAVILQQLTDKLDKGYVLKKVYYRTIKHAYKAHLDQIYLESSRLPLQYCRQVIHAAHAPQPSRSQAPIYKPPNNLQMLYFACLMPIRRMAFHLTHLFRHEDWQLGLHEADSETFIDDPVKALRNTHWFKAPPRGTYYADPFLIQYKADTLVFFETFSYRSGKGVIEMAKASENFSRMYTVLQGKHHYAFPYVFEWEGSLYCLPECYASGGVQLFVWDALKNEFRYSKTLVEDVAAVDPVLFEHNGLWWLLFTRKELPSVHVFAYYANDPFGPYQSHANNPVKSDIRASRPAGRLIRHHGKLLRPAQDCAADYGVAVVLNEIKTLNPQQFEETPVQRIEPLNKVDYAKGLHTLNFAGRYTVIDGKRFTFSLAGFRHQLLSKLKTQKHA